MICPICNHEMKWKSRLKREDDEQIREGFGFICEDCDFIQGFIEDDGDSDYDFYTDLQITEQS